MDDDHDSGEPEETERLSPKEFAKLQRRQAYQKAKEYQKTNEKFIAMKERAKERRREAYQRQKEYIKSKKASQKSVEEKKFQLEREEKDAEPLTQLRPVDLRASGHLRLLPDLED